MRKTSATELFPQVVMSAMFGAKPWRIWACVVCTLLAGSTPVHGFHTPPTHLTDDSAYTLGKKRLRVGLWKIEYGLGESVSMGSYQWPWLLKVYNLNAKWRFYDTESFSFAARLGFFSFDTRHLKALEDETGEAKITVVPLELTSTYRAHQDHDLSAALIFTAVEVDGSTDDESFEGAGEGAVDNAQMQTSWEWRLTRVTALVTNFRLLLGQRVTAAADGTYHPDEFTTVEVEGSGESDLLNFRGAWSLATSVALSFESFNLRAGVGYGNYSVPGVNFVLPRKIPFPVLDVYWIF